MGKAKMLLGFKINADVYSFFRVQRLSVYFTDASQKVIHNDPTHRAVLARLLLLRLPVAACLQASVATGNLSMGGSR